MKNQGKRVILTLLITTVILVVVSFLLSQRKIPVQTKTQTSPNLPNSEKRIDRLDLDIKALPNSIQSGKAVLTSLPGGKTKVSISVNIATTSAQPAYIHKGTCSHPEESLKLLVDIRNGQSESIIEMPIIELVESPTSIIIRKAAYQMNTYVACADIK
jgi:hypothetical protein